MGMVSMTVSVPYEDYIRELKLKIQDKNDFVMGSVGINSYVGSINIYRHDYDDAVVNLQIGNHCSLSNNITAMINMNHDYSNITTSPVGPFGFLQLDEYNKNQKGQIIIGHDVWIGLNVTLMSNIQIGTGAIIGTGAVVAKDIPPYAIAVGNPARVVKYRFEPEQIRKLLKIKWWNWNNEKIEKNKLVFVENVDEFINKFYREENEVEKLNLDTRENSILFIPDFNMPFYSVWQNVIKQYLEKYTSSDNITLILRIPQDDNFENNISKIDEFMKLRNDNPDILVINDYLEDERCLFKAVDYFITNKNKDILKYIEMANDFNVKILSGVDTNILADIIF